MELTGKDIAGFYGGMDAGTVMGGSRRARLDFQQRIQNHLGQSRALGGVRPRAQFIKERQIPGRHRIHNGYDIGHMGREGTEALLNAIPTTEDGTGKKPEILQGDIPSPVNPPKGCKFHTRCKYCTEVCTHVVPELQEVRPNHFVACHHLLEQNKD